MTDIPLPLTPDGEVDYDVVLRDLEYGAYADENPDITNKALLRALIAALEGDPDDQT